MPARRHGHWIFCGATSAIEFTAFIAAHFQEITSLKAPFITVSKAGPPLLGRDTLLLRRAEAIIAFYNRAFGSQDPAMRFTVFLPGTNRNAFGLLDNATVIMYSEFQIAKREDLLILAHEISHKWWGYGSVHDESEWLNEAFAVYSSLLYLQASGDATGYQAELAKHVQAAANAPAIIGFDRSKVDYQLFAG